MGGNGAADAAYHLLRSEDNKSELRSQENSTLTGSPKY